jgi:hypothetical protein
VAEQMLLNRLSQNLMSAELNKVQRQAAGAAIVQDAANAAVQSAEEAGAVQAGNANTEGSGGAVPSLSTAQKRRAPAPVWRQAQCTGHGVEVILVSDDDEDSEEELRRAIETSKKDVDEGSEEELCRAIEMSKGPRISAPSSGSDGSSSDVDYSGSDATDDEQEASGGGAAGSAFPRRHARDWRGRRGRRQTIAAADAAPATGASTPERHVRQRLTEIRRQQGEHEESSHRVFLQAARAGGGGLSGLDSGGGDHQEMAMVSGLQLTAYLQKARLKQQVQPCAVGRSPRALRERARC